MELTKSQRARNAAFRQFPANSSELANLESTVGHDIGYLPDTFAVSGEPRTALRSYARMFNLPGNAMSAGHFKFLWNADKPCGAAFWIAGQMGDKYEGPNAVSDEGDPFEEVLHENDPDVHGPETQEDSPEPIEPPADPKPAPKKKSEKHAQKIDTKRKADLIRELLELGDGGELDEDRVREIVKEVLPSLIPHRTITIKTPTKKTKLPEGLYHERFEYILSGLHS